MNHQKVYETIIQKAKFENRIRIKKNQIGYIYYENHHILPKCIGVNEDQNNKVLLTAREHFVCHKLLTYIYKENRKIAQAFFYMSFNKRYGNIVSSRDYAYAKELLSSLQMSTETRKKISNGKKGQSFSEDHKHNLSISHIGKIVTQKTIDKIKHSTEGKNNLYHFSKRYGETEGLILYNTYISKLKERKDKSRLQGFIEKYGEIEGTSKYKMFIENMIKSKRGQHYNVDNKTKLNVTLNI